MVDCFLIAQQCQPCLSNNRWLDAACCAAALPACHSVDWTASHPPAAGMPCGVDSRANEMMPPAVRSNRATNLFHALKASWAGGHEWRCEVVLPGSALQRGGEAPMQTHHVLAMGLALVGWTHTGLVKWVHLACLLPLAC